MKQLPSFLKKNGVIALIIIILAVTVRWLNHSRTAVSKPAASAPSALVQTTEEPKIPLPPAPQADGKAVVPNEPTAIEQLRAHEKQQAKDLRTQRVSVVTLPPPSEVALKRQESGQGNVVVELADSNGEQSGAGNRVASESAQYGGRTAAESVTRVGNGAGSVSQYGGRTAAESVARIEVGSSASSGSAQYRGRTTADSAAGSVVGNGWAR